MEPLGVKLVAKSLLNSGEEICCNAGVGEGCKKRAFANLSLGLNSFYPSFPFFRAICSYREGKLKIIGENVWVGVGAFPVRES
jgi:hypothetical protein